VNITAKQWFQIVSGIVSGLITGAALLTTLFGQDLSLKIVAGLGVFNIIVNSVGTSVSGQANLVKDVAAMPGVESILVNSKANQTLAQAAVSESLDTAKIEPITSAAAQVQQIAKGA